MKGKTMNKHSDRDYKDGGFVNDEEERKYLEDMNEATQKLVIEQRSNYGAVTFYPVNEEAHIFAEIARTKTLTVDVIKLAKKLGYEIEVKTNAVTF